jgi:hypothetical protein
MNNRKERRASEANGARMMRQGWNAFEDITAEAYRFPSFQAMTPPKPAKVYKNNLFIVQVWDPVNSAWGLVTKAGVRKNDGTPTGWAHLQQIKDELFGKEREAFELFPASSKLVDVANMYWLWVLEPEQFAPVTIQRRA